MLVSGCLVLTLACSQSTKAPPPQEPALVLEEGLLAVSEVVVESSVMRDDGSLVVGVFLLDCQGVADVSFSPVRVWAGFRPDSQCGEQVSLRTITVPPKK